MSHPILNKANECIIRMVKNNKKLAKGFFISHYLYKKKYPYNIYTYNHIYPNKGGECEELLRSQISSLYSLENHHNNNNICLHLSQK